MATLSHLKQKIKSIRTTKKITHAVRLTSMSLYTQMEKKSILVNDYAQAVESLFKNLVPSVNEWSSPFLFPKDLFDRKPLFVIISTAKGLCGSLNSNLFRSINGSLCIDKEQNPYWIAIGQKAIKFIQEKNNGITLCSYTELTTNNLETITDDILQQITNANPHFSSVTLFHSELKSVFIQKPTKSMIIPFSYATERSHQTHSQTQPVHDFIWEQSREEIITHLTILYMRSIILNHLFQSLMAEHASRFVAMDSASTNADKMLEGLTLHYNKLRQSLITMEVSELSTTSVR